MAKFVSIILILYLMFYYAYKIMLTVLTTGVSPWYIEMICHFFSFVFVIVLIHSNENENDKNGPFTP
jgi:TRAP-type mannitol/chloroaromatic compound transport system permease small subunit